MSLRHFCIVGMLVMGVFGQALTQAPVRKEGPPPQSTQPPIARPSELDKARLESKSPPLTGTGAEAAAAARAFIDWAGASPVRRREEVRRLLAEARGNRAIATAFCDEALVAIKADHSRAILTLSLLGEMGSPVGEECSRKVSHLPIPEKGTLAHGEILEQTALGTIQAKAIDGLAYLHSPSADEEVLWAAGEHPSRIVRAEAIEAYLWNHNDSFEARTVLQKYVREEERLFLDRVRRQPDENAEEFNRKLADFLKAHPEAAAPPLERAYRKKRGTVPTGDQPPVR